MTKRVTLILGGAASGKSAFAERLVTAAGGQRVYIATAEAQDAEMKAKIAAHQQARGPNWTTRVAPLDLNRALQETDHGAAILLDGVTLWLSNVMAQGAGFGGAVDAFLGAVETHPGPLVIVSDEVGQGIVPENALARAFRNALGQLNQDLAARADCVIGVMAGLPFALKGDLPDV